MTEQCPMELPYSWRCYCIWVCTRVPLSIKRILSICLSTSCEAEVNLRCACAQWVSEWCKYPVARNIWHACHVKSLERTWLHLFFASCVSTADECLLKSNAAHSEPYLACCGSNNLEFSDDLRFDEDDARLSEDMNDTNILPTRYSREISVWKTKRTHVSEVGIYSTIYIFCYW